MGGILYVDDLALISTDPSELQDMINVCQEWGERSRMQINADKSKVMAFHETTAERNSRTKPRKTRQGGIPAVVRPTPFHILSRFPNRFPLDRHPAGFLSTRLEEVKEFVYLGLRLDSNLTMKPAVSEIQKRANKAHGLVMAVSYSIRYDRNHHNPALGCPTSRMLQLWKATVLPHYLLHLRYACTPTLVDELQAPLTRSLETCLHVFGDKTAILAETGVPPLSYTQHVQLAQFHFRLRHHTHLVIPHFLWSYWASHLPTLPTEALDRRMPASTRFLDPDRLVNPGILPRCVASAKEAHREKSYQRYLQSRVTSKWRLALQQDARTSHILGRSNRYLAYIGLHSGDLLKRTSVYKAAHYLRSPFPAQLELLRLRAQAWSLVLPCHQWRLAARSVQRLDYANRFCPLCLPLQHLGTEAHMILDCPYTNCVWIQFLDKFKGLARLLDLPPLYA